MLTYNEFIIVLQVPSIHLNFVSVLILSVITLNRLNHVTEALWGPQSFSHCKKVPRPNHLRTGVLGQALASWGLGVGPEPSSVHLFSPFSPLAILRGWCDDFHVHFTNVETEALSI